MTSDSGPLRGDVWLADLGIGLGHEQGGARPVLIVSADGFNLGGAGLVVTLPITSVDKRIPWHAIVEAPEGGLRERSYIKCEDVRSIAKERLGRRLGSVTRETMEAVDYRLRILMEL
ncbi:MAG: type II toxin-antitoxin system PemK/MazF family toxin [Chloroflexi bacterium]|nr:type II toxin-antitoxin system PemK/MazF family toxin [Chloroflexota bacterium]